MTDSDIEFDELSDPESTATDVASEGTLHERQRVTQRRIDVEWIRRVRKIFKEKFGPLYIAWFWPEGKFDDLDCKNARAKKSVAGVAVEIFACRLREWEDEVKRQNIDDFLWMIRECVDCFRIYIVESFRLHAQNRKCGWRARMAIFVQFIPVFQELQHELQSVPSLLDLLQNPDPDHPFPEWKRLEMNILYNHYEAAVNQLDEELKLFVKEEYAGYYPKNSSCVIQSQHDNPYVCLV